MNEYNFCDEIKNKFNVEELESSTLNYRINGFIYACNMDLEDSPCVKEISKTRIPYINKKNAENENVKYSINFARRYDQKKGKNFIVVGKYGNLDLMFINYYDKDKNINKINEIPFYISLNKVYNDITYKLELETVSKNRVKFTIKKNKENEILPITLSFYANITDFGKVLRLVKSFVRNPEVVFIAYNEIMNRKEVNFTNKDLNVALAMDEKLEKPLSKSQKILKKLTNND